MSPRTYQEMQTAQYCAHRGDGQDKDSNGALRTHDADGVINVRQHPGTSEAVKEVVQSGERISLYTIEVIDNYCWYMVILQSSGESGWVRGDLIQWNEAAPHPILRVHP